MNKRKTIILVLASCTLVYSSSSGQKITFSQNIAPIIKSKCSGCHQPGEIAPFSLLSYNDVKKRAKLIEYVVDNNVMPPWPADTSYRRYLNEKVLSQNEVLAIKGWINQGYLPGDTAKTGKSYFLMDAIDPKPDYVLTMQKKHHLTDLNRDVFKRMHIPSDIDRDINVSGFKFVPGNRSVVHHSELFFDSAGTLELDFSPNELSYIKGDTYILRDTTLRPYWYASGWLPGMGIEAFPKGMVMRIKKDANFYFLIHYIPTPVEEYDSSSFNIYTYKDKPERYIEVIPIWSSHHMVNGPLLIPADTVITFHSVNTIEKDLSAFSVLAHAHHLAQKMLAYAVTPINDTISLLRINDWDFNWQYIYKFKKYIVLPKGTKVHFWVTYDNTPNNPENPFVPPRDITSSFKADDEMMELFIYTVPYKANDENESVVYSEGF